MFTPDTKMQESRLISNVAALFNPHREVMEEMPRAEEFRARTDAEHTEEWTDECLFDWYNH